MEQDSNLLLTTVVQMLEMMKVTLEGQIALIRQQVDQARPQRKLPNDPNVLGFDSLGRIIKRRKISPELRARRIEMINKARQTKLSRLKGEAQ